MLFFLCWEKPHAAQLPVLSLPCHSSGGRGKTRAVPSTIQISHKPLWKRQITKKGRIANHSFTLNYHYCYCYYYYYYYWSFIPSFANSLCCWQAGCEGDGWKMCRGMGKAQGQPWWFGWASLLNCASKLCCMLRDKVVCPVDKSSSCSVSRCYLF